MLQKSCLCNVVNKTKTKNYAGTSSAQEDAVTDPKFRECIV